MATSLQYIEKLNKLEKEILKLRKEGVRKIPQVFLSLKGILKGVTIMGKDIEASKKSLFKSTKM